MNAEAPVRAIIAGAGLMGRWHADAVRRTGGLVVAVVDPDRRRAEALAHRYGGAAIYDDLVPALAARQGDLVHLCTPLPTHAPLARAALDADYHVLVEKPLAEDVAATQALLDLAANRRRQICPVHQFLFQPGVLAAHAALSRLAPIRRIEFVACSAGAEGGDTQRQRAVALEILPHPLSLLARLLPILPDAIDWQSLEPTAGELSLTGLAEGVVISIAISMHGRPPRNQLTLIGEGGTLQVDLFHGYHLVEPAGLSRLDKATRPFRSAGRTIWAAGWNGLARARQGELAYPGLTELVRRFHRACRGAGPSPLTVEEIMAVARAQAQVTARRTLTAQHWTEVS